MSYSKPEGLGDDNLYFQVLLTALLLFVCEAASNPLSSRFLQSLLGTSGLSRVASSGGDIISSNSAGPNLVWLQPGENWEAIEGQPVDYDEDIFSYVPNVGFF